MSHRTQGYTIFELAIVLVIVALIIGTIVAAQSIIAASRLQSVVTDVDRFKKAAQLFKDKYKDLPGDIPTATALWGTDGGGCPSTTANIVAKRATCNGNGDSFIGDSTGSPLGGAANWYESYRFWQHLASAGLIEGQYTGALSSRTASNNADPGMNIPVSRVPGNGFTMLHAAPTGTFGSAGALSGVFGANYHHILVYGIPAGKYASAYNPGLSLSDALSIDQKIDDGYPGQGNVLSFTPDLAATANCASSHTESSAVYNTSTAATLKCSLVFITGF